ncbi:MAG: DNA methyltransferase, partial [Bacteroidia bacterium]
MSEIRIENIDCLEFMKSLPDNSVDAAVCDPPYGLKFMGKKWDYDVPSVEIWQECLRVLKPGGYLLAFAGTRTQHRMACRIEDAGFEIRDMIAWVYGCLSEDTEILTENGFVDCDKSSLSDSVLCYNVDNDSFEFHKPER